MMRSAGLTGAALLALLASGCGERPAAPAEVELSAAEKAGYLAAPEIAQVVSGPGGALMVHGRTRPGGRIRATTPAGEAYGATADAEGRYAIELPPRTEAVLAAISAESQARSTAAEGWLFVPPGEPSHAALLRPGSPALVLGAEPGLLAAVDFDPAGGAGVAGKAAPDAEVRVSIDGSPAGQARSDAQGRWSLRLSRVSPGAHAIHVVSGDAVADRTVTLAAAPPPAGAFEARRDPLGWRVVWATPGGGLQSSIIIAGPSAR